MLLSIFVYFRFFFNVIILLRNIRAAFKMFSLQKSSLNLTASKNIHVFWIHVLSSFLTTAEDKAAESDT